MQPLNQGNRGKQRFGDQTCSSSTFSCWLFDSSSVNHKWESSPSPTASQDRFCQDKGGNERGSPLSPSPLKVWSWDRRLQRHLRLYQKRCPTPRLYILQNIDHAGDLHDQETLRSPATKCKTVISTKASGQSTLCPCSYVCAGTTFVKREYDFESSSPSSPGIRRRNACGSDNCSQFILENTKQERNKSHRFKG